MTPTLIRRSGNILEVSPDHANLLKPALTYTHRDQSQGFGFHKGRRPAIKFVERFLGRVMDGKLLTLQGARKRIEQVFHKHSIPFQYQDLRTKQELEPDYDHFAEVMADVEFRYRQDEIIAILIAEDSGVVVAPTAYGKTFIMLALTVLYPKANIIITSPSVGLLDSTYRRILKITPSVGRVGGTHHDTGQRVTLSTFGSIMKAPIGACDILLIDECHRAPAPQISDSLSKIRSPVKIFGLTATPKGRSDGAELAMEVLIGPTICKIDYDEVVEQGSIAQLKVAVCRLPDLPMPYSAGARMKVTKKRWCYWRNDVRNQSIARACQVVPARYGLPDTCQTLVLVETVDHAFRLAEFLPDYTVVYASMDKQKLQDLKDAKLVPEDYTVLSPAQRADKLKQFEAGTLRKVIATGCWGEGVDFVYLDVLANASGAPSQINITQWSGRNSRLHDGKSFGLVLDFDDAWDPWTSGRAKERISVYRKHRWDVAPVMLGA